MSVIPKGAEHPTYEARRAILAGWVDEFIKQNPDKTKKDFARQIGISDTYLYGLISEPAAKQHKNIDTKIATRIENALGRHGALLAAGSPFEAPRQVDQLHACEALDRTHLCMHMVGEFLLEHPYVQSDEVAHMLLEQAAELLGRAYQRIGKKAAAVPPPRGGRPAVADLGNLGATLRSLREAHGFTLQEVGDWFGIDKASVHGWEKSGKIPEMDKLFGLARRYNTTLDDLITGAVLEVVGCAAKAGRGLATSDEGARHG